MASASQAAPDPGEALLPVRHKALLTIGIMMAMMMQLLDVTIANVALPHMQTSLGATIDSIAWVLTSYIVASAVLIPITGWLADRIGSRELFLISVGTFIVTSMLCGAATSLEQMVIFRTLQGISAAFIAPLSQTAMLDINRREKHGQAMAIWSAGAVLGPIMGPLIGGWLTEYYSWRWVFYVNLPIGTMTFTLLYFLLPGRTKHRRGFDLFGFAMFALGIASLQLMLDRGQLLDWFDSAEIWVMLGLAIAGLWVFVVHMATARTTIIRREVFRDRNFVGALVASAMVGVVVFVTMALLTLMLQGVFGYPVIDTGLVLAPRGIGVMTAMIVASRLMHVFDARLLLGVGFAICAYSFWLMTGWSVQIDAWVVVSTGLLQGFGIGFVLVLLNVIAFATLSPALRPEGASLLNLVRNLGASIGISIGATSIARNQQTSHAELAEHLTRERMPSLGLDTLGQYGLSDEARLLLLDNEINRQALMIAYVNDFQLLMIACIVTAPLVLVLKRLPRAGATST